MTYEFLAKVMCRRLGLRNKTGLQLFNSVQTSQSTIGRNTFNFFLWELVDEQGSVTTFRQRELVTRASTETKETANIFSTSLATRGALSAQLKKNAFSTSAPQCGISHSNE